MSNPSDLLRIQVRCRAHQLGEVPSALDETANDDLEASARMFVSLRLGITPLMCKSILADRNCCCGETFQEGDDPFEVFCQYEILQKHIPASGRDPVAELLEASVPELFDVDCGGRIPRERPDVFHHRVQWLSLLAFGARPG